MKRCSNRSSFLLCLLAVTIAGCTDDLAGLDSARPSAEAIPKVEAVQKVIDEVLMPAGLGASDVVVYGPVEPLQAGERVLPVLEADGAHAEVFVIEHPTWFFWIDLMPFARFAHPTQFVYVDASTGEVRVQDQMWYAVLNAEEFLPIEDKNDPRRVFGDPVHPESLEPGAVGKVTTLEAGKSRFGIDSGLRQQGQEDELKSAAIVANGWPGSTDTKQDFDNMVKALGDRRYTVKPVPPNPAGKQATKDSILAALDALAGSAEPLRQVVFYYTGHGTSGNLNMGSEKETDITIGPVEIARKIAAIDALETVIILDACETGAFVLLFGTVLAGGELNVTDKTVAVYSASDASQLSWTDYDGGGSFTNLLLKKINELPLGEPLPFVTHGSHFQIEPFGWRRIIPALGPFEGGNDTR